MIRPTLHSLRIAIALAFGSVLVAGLVPHLWWAIAALWGALGFLMLVDTARALPGGAFWLTVDAPNILYIGEGDPLTLALSTEKGGQGVQVRIAPDTQGPVQDLVEQSRQLDENGSVDFPYYVTPTARGQVSLPRIFVGWNGPLNLVERRRTIDTAWSVPVIPNVRAVQRDAIQLRKLAQDFGAKMQRIVGSGSEFESLREFQTGMEVRHIDWKHSARHRKLLVREMQVERNHQIVLAHDTGYLMREPLEGIPKLDHAVNATLMLSWLALTTGDQVGLYGFADKPQVYIAPRVGKSSFNGLRLATSDLDYVPQETNFTLGLSTLGQRLGRRSLVVLFTDFVDTTTAELLVENIAALTRKHLVIFAVPRDTHAEHYLDQQPQGLVDATRAVVAEAFDAERRIVFDRLKRLGVEVLEVPPAGFSVALLNRYLAMKERNML